MSLLQPVIILLIAGAFVGGALLGWLLRGERQDRGDGVRRARMQAQLDASQESAAKLQRQRDALQKKSDDAVHRHHAHQRQVRAYREGLDELAMRNRKLEQKVGRAKDQLKEALGEREKLARQLKLMIRRTRAAREVGESLPVTPAQTTANGDTAIDNAATDNATRDDRPTDLSDLQKVRGIGPAIAKKLRALGIEDLGQIAKLDDEGIDALDQELSFPGRIRRDDWVGQARTIVAVAQGQSL